MFERAAIYEEKNKQVFLNALNWFGKPFEGYEMPDIFKTTH